MAKFRIKPNVIEAERWYPGKSVDGVKHGLIDLGAAAFYVDSPQPIGRTVVQAGDWIMTGANGDKYAVKPALFEQFYEPIPEGEPITDADLSFAPERFGSKF
jgi:hypothetical protein